MAKKTQAQRRQERYEKHRIKMKDMMFAEYAEKINQLEGDYSGNVLAEARKAALKFEKYAKEDTDRLKVYDTGAYKGSWGGKVTQLNYDEVRVDCYNRMDYASVLEKGYVTKKGNRVKGYFIGTRTFKKVRQEVIDTIRKQFKKDAK